MRAEAIREQLARGGLCLVANTLVQGRKISDREIEWLVDALAWINIHAGRAGGGSLVDGQGLLAKAPKKAELD